MLFFHSKMILIFTLMLMASTISVASVTNQDFGIASGKWIESELRQLEEDRRVWIEKVLEAEIDISLTDEDGNTPLMIAVKYALDDNAYLEDWSEVVMALLELGADVTATDEDGNTPLAEAINSNSDHRITIALVEARDRLSEASSSDNEDRDSDDRIIKVYNNYEKNNEMITLYLKPSIPSPSPGRWVGGFLIQGR